MKLRQFRRVFQPETAVVFLNKKVCNSLKITAKTFGGLRKILYLCKVNKRYLIPWKTPFERHARAHGLFDAQALAGAAELS